MDIPVGKSPDIELVGRGPVALALALWLVRQGFEPARIAVDTSAIKLPEALAARSLALSAGSWQLLARICRLPEAARITRVVVSMSGHAGRARLDAAESGLPALGCVVRYAGLIEALRQAAAPLGFAAPATAPAPTVDVGAGPGLVVHAEGQPGPDAQTREFDQSALVAEVELAPPSGAADAGTAGGIAYECFTPHGPLALLPLPEPGRHSLVWCGRPEDGERRLVADETDFLDELSRLAGLGLVATRLCSPRQLAPLARRRRETTVAEHEVWIGNAAQALHPVAGQGLNLGLRDAFELARELGRSQRPGAADGNRAPWPAALARHRRHRRVDRSVTVGITDALARLFTVPALAPWESLALGLLDLHPTLRQRLAKQMMFGRR